MKSQLLKLSSALVLGSLVTSCTGTGGDDSPSTEGGEVYVKGIPRLEQVSERPSVQEPSSLNLQYTVHAGELEWFMWGPDTAMATGQITGKWCIPECHDSPYEATIILCDVQDNHFKRYSIQGDFQWNSGTNDLEGLINISDRAQEHGCASPQA
ncbi:hypothetical protein [Natronoglycomyces albus]|uniref:Uncharacterized protein n=1 Tax=Natronoglycomyces albus TaxID=2811108 RepID=A0A895XKN6_9ACTN|nr:hypothetical protein [Natronoglycomyces albus]QSB04372.1 hypothetical protein JQS30_11270 [Natronoglycomyces albus]